MPVKPPTPTPRPVTRGAPPAKPPPHPQSKLSSVRRGRLSTAHRFLIYGQEGVGKSQLAAAIPGVLFLDVEGGSGELDVARYVFRPEDAASGHVALTYEDVLGAVDDLIAHPGHGYSAVAIDTVDALEAMIHRFISERDKKTGIEGYGYGRGFRFALDEIRVFISRLDVLRRQDVSIVLIGHAGVSKWKNPEGDDFDRYQLRMHLLAAGQIKEWCDVVGFMHFEGGAAKGPEETRARGWATGKRLIAFSRDAAWDGKTRIALPPILEVSAVDGWAPIAAARAPVEEVDATMHQDIMVELDRLTGGNYGTEFTTAAGNKTTGDAVVAMLNTTDGAVLARVLAGLRATATPTSTQENQ